MTKIALVDDHILLRKGLKSLINSFKLFDIIFEADNGVDFISKIDEHGVPEIVLLDITMPEMDGYETAQWIRNNHPRIRVLTLSMLENEISIIRMIKYGAKGYILKDSEPAELKIALQKVAAGGFYSNDFISSKLIRSLNQFDEQSDRFDGMMQFNEKEIKFLELNATEMGYKEIADIMQISPRTVEGYRESLCEKLNVKTRIGLVIFAIKNGIVQL